MNERGPSFRRGGAAWLGPLLLVAALPALSGCVAALIPVAAAGAYGGKKLLGGDLRDRSDRRSAAAAQTTGAAGTAALGKAELLDLTALPAPTARDLGYGVPASLPEDAVESPDYIDGFLASLGEAQRAGRIGESVILMPSTDPASPQVTLCQGLPYALLVALDSLPAGRSPDEPPAMLLDAVESARRAGIAVVFTSNMPSDAEPRLVAALQNLGLGPAVRGKTLWMLGDRGTTDPDSLHWKIASNYCIVAMLADLPGDFTSLYGRFPDEAMRASNVASLWNAGWFLSTGPLVLPDPAPFDPTQPAPATGDPSTIDNGVIP